LVKEIFKLALHVWLPAFPVESLAQTIKTILPAMRAVNLLLSLALLFLIFKYSAKISQKSALLASFIVATSSNLILYSNVVMLDMAYALFTTAFLLFYLITYYEQRTIKNTIILGILLSFALLSKLYLPFIAILPVIFLESWRAYKEKNVDFKLIGGIVLGVLLFQLGTMALSHYAPNPNSTSAPDKLSFAFGFEMIWLILSRLEIISLILLPLAIWIAYRSSKNAEVLEKPTLRAGIAALIFSIPFILIPDKSAAIRYALPIFPLIAFFVSSAVMENLDKWKTALIALLVLITLGYAAFHYPYYDSYSNPINYLHKPLPTERTNSLSVLKFLANETEKIWTNEDYQFPYYSKLNSKHFISLEINETTPNTFDNIHVCNDPKLFEAVMLGENRPRVIYRKIKSFGLVCSALEPTLEKFQLIYSDDYYAVFDLTKRIT